MNGASIGECAPSGNVTTTTAAAKSKDNAVTDAPLPKGVTLEQVAYGRSGDKGDTANIAIIARQPEHYGALRAFLTAERVAAYFNHYLAHGAQDVERFDCAGVHAMNFVLRNALGGGGVASLRVDPQGKAYAQMLLQMKIE